MIKDFGYDLRSRKPKCAGCKKSHLRIIAGKLRSRKIYFVSSAPIRPTTDRMRETLFNWLVPYIKNARCLDCFAGSGALGFEALSRGASSVTMIDASRKTILDIQENAKILGLDTIDFYVGKIPNLVADFLKVKQFDIVFLDPPFHKNLIEPTIDWLIRNNLLKASTVVYVETEKNLKLDFLPCNWRLLKSQRTQQVAYYLFQSGTSESHDQVVI